ncbi:glycosyltransferase [Acinetobacter junii]|uniref:glycosyltransferase n=1 Tax=Acinetobacter junii TaxID=40215 RepID=UPI00124F8E8F|nr:glycosyltransferase [Acinetobacter junii]MEB8382652.1 glycosyltransferase [Acinetobacter junii]
MKVLLLGEYSGVHTNLSKALKEKGYLVDLIHNGDSYKEFDADYLIKYNYYSSKSVFLNFFIRIYYVLLLYSGFQGFFQIFKYLKKIKALKNYDIVQIINPIFLSDFGFVVNMFVFLYLKFNNKKIFVCALGDDFSYVFFCLKKGFKYSMFDRLGLKTIHRYLYQLHYVFGFMGVGYHYIVLSMVNGIIPGLYDYYAVYKHKKKCTRIIPIIVSQDYGKSSFSYPIKVFHGWQPRKEYRKGNDILHKVFLKLKENHPDKINYEVVGGVKYAEYVKMYRNSDLFVDQCFSQDTGVNGLLGMAQGKVVISGFEKEVKDYYGINYNPLLNVEPQEDLMYQTIENVILDLGTVEQYSINAFRFISDFHNSDYVVGLYNEVWNSY